jgi:chromate transporter
MVLALAWVYVTYGATPAAAWLLYGVQPVIIAIVIKALWGLGRTAMKGPLAGVIGLAALVDGLTVGVALLAAVLLLRYKLNSTWLIAGGAVIGLLAGWWG